MSNYKLIKEYPGSPELGYITQFDNKDEDWCAPNLIIVSDCEKYPEFWEKIVEKNYEILSFISSNGCIHTKRENNKFVPTNIKGNGCYTKEGYLSSKEFTIHSVKRLSDGQVFTINDKCSDGVITKFEILDDVLIVFICDCTWIKLDLIQKVVEKKYEILSFRQLTGTCKNYITKGTICIKNMNSLLKDVKNGNQEIYSVKRLSDGEIFSIGDEVQYDSSVNSKKYLQFLNPYKIDKFYIDSLGRMIAEGYNKKDNVRNGACIIESQNFRKSKPVLFTTEDGVDIYEGDVVYLVNYYFKYFSIKAVKETLLLFPANKFFSLPEKAEEYILMNKPCLSIKEIAPIFGMYHLDNSKTALDRLTDRLKDLVKNKLC